MAEALDAQRSPAFSVFSRFRMFWKEVEAVRADILTQAVAPSAPTGLSEPASASGSAPSPALVQVPTKVREQLLGVLRAQEAEVARFGTGPVFEYYREAQYVMVATADEVFVRLPWSGASSWASNPLETDLFGSRCAGQAIFERIERLAGTPDATTRELAAVYLTALALGFEGRYAGRPDRRAIDGYKRQLRELIFGTNTDLTDPFRRLIPQCYDNTITAGAGRKLRSPRVWWWATAVVLIVWVITSRALWRGLRAPLDDQLAAIGAISATPDSRK